MDFEAETYVSCLYRTMLWESLAKVSLKLDERRPSLES